MARTNNSNGDRQSIVQRLGPKGIAGIIIGIIAIVFIVENSQRTRIRFIAPEVKAPLWLALLIAAALGALAGALVAHRRQK